jgi:formamidopyrimidine-DNA glycosylase
MPEGPELKTVAESLRENIIGKRLGSLWYSSLPLRRKPRIDMLNRLSGKFINDIEVHGKVIFIIVDKNPAILVQLGMTGQLIIADHSSELLPHTHIRWPLMGTGQELRYVDPRRFGLIDGCNEEEKKDILSRLGPDPFSMTEPDYQAVNLRIRQSSRAIKEIILDQSLIAGVGNIYASESLFLAKINPLSPGNSLSKDAVKRLLEAIKIVLEKAFNNRGTSFSNYVDGFGKSGKNQEFLKVFQREGLSCKSCGAVLERIKQSGRSTFFCPCCQK